MSNGYLTEVGKKYILSSFFKGESIQDKLYIGLCGNISLEGQIEGEPVGHTGYMRVVLNGESWKMADGVRAAGHRAGGQRRRVVGQLAPKAAS